MIVFDDFFEAKVNTRTIVTVGKFDGFHMGHNLLLEELSKHEGMESCIVTFSTPVNKRIKKDYIGQLITNEERLIVLKNEGIDYLINCPFDERIMKTPAADFVKKLCDNLNMRHMVVGSDFRFGYKNLGDVRLLKELSKEYDFKLTVLDKIQKENRDISSTFIREELVKGNIEKVNELLGYGYFIWGHVVHGNQLGHELGFPTINMNPPGNKLPPKPGVYITDVVIDNKTYHGITNVGVKPTVTGENRLGIETHIINYSGDLYGEDIKIVFLSYLREEIKFDSVRDLTSQLESDLEKAKKFFGL